MRIVLANQGTYLAYIRTSFAVVALATKFKSLVVILVGMLLITVGVYQYYTIDLDLENQVHRLSNKEIPLTYTVAGLMAIYYYFSM